MPRAALSLKSNLELLNANVFWFYYLPRTQMININVGNSLFLTSWLHIYLTVILQEENCIFLQVDGLFLLLTNILFLLFFPGGFRVTP